MAALVDAWALLAQLQDALVGLGLLGAGVLGILVVRAWRRA
ncbi:hypothetical protein [Pyxidicoccus fallax]|nr:hypothetical protein [Pyxidicoccus fallax]